MTIFSGIHAPGNQFKMEKFLCIPNHWRKFAKITIIIVFKYDCTTMAESHRFCFPVIQEKNFKQKTTINKGYSKASYVTKTDRERFQYHIEYFSLHVFHQ